jgi:predicted Ser/Thr protein kinase
MPERSEPPADADPAVADTVSSADSASAASASASASGSGSRGTPKRAVHAGDVLGRYELVEEVGEGGMATVFRARDKELRREVAVKVLFPHLAKRDDVVRRFHREARAAAALEHANILRVYDVGGGEASDPPYIVMELVRGQTLLAEVEQHGPMQAELVACVGALLADALVVAHKAGVIHRDIKPSNVLIAGDGRVLLADFGVARLETEDSLVTKTGALLGTPAYMSPEQAGGDTTTAKSDLYSLGATLYQLATGALPFSGNAAKVMASIASGALVSPVKRRAGVGPDLSRLIEKMMAVDPMARPASAAEVGKELRAIAAAGGLADAEAEAEVVAYFVDRSDWAKRRMPAIVAAVVAGSRKAIAEGKLPRGLAMADRAAALAPDDEAVKALVHDVTEGGRASRRRRAALVFGLGAVAVGGAAAAGVMALQRGGGSGGPEVRGSGELGSGPDLGSATAGSGVGPLSAAVQGSGAGPLATAGSGAGPLSAAVQGSGAGPRAGAGQRHADAGVRDAAEIAIDAAGEVRGIDAGVVVGFGAIVVRNDTWCEIAIDGMPRGRALRTPLKVEAGHHTVSCGQNGKPGWTKEVDVGAGETKSVEGSLLGSVEITFAIDATIDGVRHRAGDRVTVPVARHELAAGKTKQFRDIRSRCTVRQVDDGIDCL